MPLPSSGPLSLQNIQTEFGGTNPIGLSEYYAGGGLVPAGTTGTNGPVPSSGAISIFNFYGTQAGVIGQTWANLSSSPAAFTAAAADNMLVSTWSGSIFLSISVLPTFIRVLSSTDGTTWNVVSSNINRLLRLQDGWLDVLRVSSEARLYFLNGRWFFTGDSPTYYYSTDNGATWVAGSLAGAVAGASTVLMTFIPGVSRYVAVVGFNQAAYSSDGITWVSSSASYLAAVNLSPNNGGTKIGSAGCSLTASNTRAVSFGYSSETAGAWYQMIALTTDDGINWTYRSGCAAVYGTGKFGTPRGQNLSAPDGLTIPDIPGTADTVATSDGITYTLMTTMNTTVGQFCMMTKIGSTYVALSRTSRRFGTSTSGTTWTTAYTAPTNSITNYITASPSLVLAAGYPGRIFTTPNGSTYTIAQTMTSTTMTVTGMIKNGSLTIAVGLQSTCATSSNNGNTWTVQSGLAAVSGSGLALANYFSISFNGTNYVVVGGRGTQSTTEGSFACYSTDGITWVRSTSFTSVTGGTASTSYFGVNGLARSGTTFCTTIVDSMSRPRAIRSADGITWTSVTIGSINVNYAFIIWSSQLNLFLLCGARSVSQNVLSTSPDAATWTNRSPAFNTAYGSTNIVGAIASSSSSPLVVAVGTGGSCVTSTDGISWTLRTGLSAVTTANMTAITWAGSFFIAAGNGASATSTDGITWVLRPDFTTVFSGNESVANLYYNGSELFALGVNGKIARSPS